MFLKNGDFTTVPCQFDDWKSWKNLGRVFSCFSVIALKNGDFTTAPCQFDDWKAWKNLRRVFAFFSLIAATHAW